MLLAVISMARTSRVRSSAPMWILHHGRPSPFIVGQVWIAASPYSGGRRCLPVGGGTRTMSGSNRIVSEPRCFSARAGWLRPRRPHRLTIGWPIPGLVTRREGSAHADRLPCCIHQMNPSRSLCEAKPRAGAGRDTVGAAPGAGMCEKAPRAAEDRLVVAVKVKLNQAPLAGSRSEWHYNRRQLYRAAMRIRRFLAPKPLSIHPEGWVSGHWYAFVHPFLSDCALTVPVETYLASAPHVYLAHDCGRQSCRVAGPSGCFRVLRFP